MMLFSLDNDDFKLLLTTLQPPEQVLVKEFLQCALQHAEERGIDTGYVFMDFVDKCNIPRVTLLKEGILSQALWISFLNVMRFHTPATSPLFKYRDNAAFMQEYGEKFAHYDQTEVTKLTQTANWMNILFTMVPAKKNKGLSIHVIPKLVEGTKAKYITGSGQTQATADRVFVYEHEGNIVPYQRGASKKKAEAGEARPAEREKEKDKEKSRAPAAAKPAKPAKPTRKTPAPVPALAPAYAAASAGISSSGGTARQRKRERDASGQQEGGAGRQRRSSPYEDILTHYANRDQTTTMGSCTSGIGLGLGMGLGAQGPVVANSTIDLYRFWTAGGESELGPRPSVDKKAAASEGSAPAADSVVTGVGGKAARRRQGGGKAVHGGMSGVDFQECLSLLSSSSSNSLASLLTNNSQLHSAPGRAPSLSPRLVLESPRTTLSRGSSGDAALDSPRVDIEGVDIEAEDPAAAPQQVSVLNYSTSDSHSKSKLLKKSSFQLRKSSSAASMDLSSTNSLMDLLERHISDDSIQNWSEGAQMTSSVVLQAGKAGGKGGDANGHGSSHPYSQASSRTGSRSSACSAESPFLSSPHSLSSPLPNSISPRALTDRLPSSHRAQQLGGGKEDQSLLGPPLLPTYTHRLGRPAAEAGGGKCTDRSPGGTLARNYSWGTLCPAGAGGEEQDLDPDPESSFSNSNVSSSLTGFPMARQDSTDSVDLVGTAGHGRGSAGNSPLVRKNPSLPTLGD